MIAAKTAALFAETLGGTHPSQCTWSQGNHTRTITMKLFADVTKRADSLLSKFEQTLAARIAELRKQGKRKEEIQQIVQSEFDSKEGFAAGFDQELDHLLDDTVFSKKPPSAAEIPNRVSSERARLLRIKASEFSYYVPQVSTVKAAVDHVQKVSYWSQASILLYQESDKREPNPDLQFEFYDGLFDTYTEVLLKARCYHAVIWACTEFLTNKQYTQRCRRTNFVERITARLNKAQVKLQSSSSANNEALKGWQDAVTTLISGIAQKADLIDWDAIRQVDECQEYVWKLGPSLEHCADCLSRAGQVKTYDEWFELGVPGFAKTSCRDACTCELKKTKELSL